MRASWVVIAASLLVVPAWPGPDDVAMKFADCPAPVKKTLLAEAPDAKIETVTREHDDDNETIYWAEAVLAGKTYAIGVLADGTLSEMNLAFDDGEIPLDQAPESVRDSFKAEAFGQKVESVTRSMKYGVTLYEALVRHKDRSYQLAIAEDGTLFEKVLIIDDEEIDLEKCPGPVLVGFRRQAHGGAIHDVTRSTGILRPTYEASVEVKNKVYLVEVDEAGTLISKTLEAGED
jgi:hypothetical protein